MMRLSIVLILMILFTSCNNKPGENLDHINGYWGIEKVEFTKDSIRDFKINEIVDYIEIIDSLGFRVKVKPQFDGTYIPAGEPEKINVTIEENKVSLNYSTAFNNWKEVIVASKEDELSLKNERGIIYHYKRYKPLKLDLDEKENE
ncbi:lipocalin family protein [Gillisia sp. CAL575]|uniref:lipocalin family protein n=1 Tax=Gillisia sp. CAL575 TaxID=985255 RepID=UPI0005559298|nr:lipocalin family protein [Gillisia sp. CAL575]